jgi:rhomboid protease GluP
MITGAVEKEIRVKTDFIKAFIKKLIMQKGFIPLRDAEGNLNLDRPVNILTKDSYGSAAIIEVLDGDSLTDEEIAARIQGNTRRLSEIKAGTAYYFMEVFIFNRKPEQETQETIVSNHFQNVGEKKFLQCISIDLSAGTVEKHFKAPASDFGISKVVRSIMDEGIPEGIQTSEINELVIQKEKDNTIEFKVKTPLVTYTLIGINILVAALIYLYSLKSGKDYGDLLPIFGAKVNGSILAGEYWRFITPVFLHAGLVHLLINCYSLYAIGVSVERIFGRPRFLAVYFIAGILGNIFSFVFSPNPGVGASGAIFGLLGALLYFGLEKPALFRRFFGNSILITIFINLTYGFSSTGIDNSAHIGGLIGGFLATGFVSRPARTRWYFNRALYIVLTICIAVSGLAYGFNNKQSRIYKEVGELTMLEKAENWDMVESKAEDILAMNPGDTNIKTSVFFSLINAEYANQKLDEAVQHANELILANPQAGHYLLGEIYFQTKQYDLSKNEFLEAQKAGASIEQIDQRLSEIEKLQGQ